MSTISGSGSKPKLTYVAPLINLGHTDSLGVKKKILSQAKCFQSYGFDVEIADCPNKPKSHPPWLTRNYSPIVNLLMKPVRRVWFFPHSVRYKRISFALVVRKVAELGPTHVYLRHTFLSVQVAFFYRKLRQLPNVCRLYLEVPTWPYDKELRFRPHERLLRPLIHQLADRVVTFSDKESIFGSATIRISNGIDVEGTPLMKSEAASNEFRIICVGTLNSWMGLDRLLRGVSIYMNGGIRDQGLKVVIVGAGRMMEPWRALCEKLKITEVVEFLGTLTGEALDEEFQGANIAIGNLANHRRNLSTNSDLKNKEYCARAIPFVTSAGDDAFPAEFPFLHQLSPDNSPVDIQELIHFHEMLVEHVPDFREQMRAYARDNLDWKNILKPIIDDIRQNA